jgi:YVTN family beta-propeller protein
MSVTAVVIKVYVSNSDTISVIATATNTATATIPAGGFPCGVAVTPDGSQVYVTNASNTVSVIATATNMVTATIPVGRLPFGVAVTPDGSQVYVANRDDNTVSVIATATNMVTATIPVGRFPVAFGAFIQPLPIFAGTPGFSNCWGQSVAALAEVFGGLGAAAAALGFPRATALQDAIAAFCRG